MGLALLAGVSLYVRGPLAVDETRYLTVAWEMWQRNQEWVPLLHGAPYAHKPPLLFWLIQAGWKLFGVNEWWPRTLSPLFVAASILLTVDMARTLWPMHRSVAQMAGFVLMGSLLFALFATAVMFDILLTFCVLLALRGLLATRTSVTGWWLFVAGLALGIFAKGPVALLHILPAAVLAPLWQDVAPRAWYPRLAVAVAGAVVVVLAWAIPAALQGGSDYADAIFWGQTAGRMVESFAHHRPWWWYLPLLPLMLFPWLCWARLWRAWPELLRHAHPDAGVRFALAALAPPLVAFSLVSGKQPHYLLPLFPAFALLSARALGRSTVLHGSIVPALCWVALGAAILALPWLRVPSAWAAAPGQVGAWSGALLVMLGIWQGRLRGPAAPLVHVRRLTRSTIIGLCVLMLGVVGPIYRLYYDLAPASAYLQALQARGEPIAHLGDDHGRFGFLGRLARPVTTLERAQLPSWWALHPNGHVVAYCRGSANTGAGIEFAQRFRSRTLVVTQAREVERACGS